MSVGATAAPAAALPSVSRLVSAVRTVYRGPAVAVEHAVVCLLSRGHLLIEDVPGVGKTTLALALGKALGLGVHRLQFTPDTLPSDILGLTIFNQQTQGFDFHPGPVFTPILVADEINRATPKTQAALLEAMNERSVTVDGETRPLPEPFLVLATQNPIEYLGTYPLPESQLDRFLMALELGYPDAAAERELLAGGDRRAKIAELVPLADAATLVDWQREAAALHVAPALLDYVQALLAASRGHASGAGTADTGARRGLSPRAGLMLLNAARAWAIVGGRPMVLPEDVQAEFPAVAGHRLAGGARAGALAAQSLLRSVPLP